MRIWPFKRKDDEVAALRAEIEGLRASLAIPPAPSVLSAEAQREMFRSMSSLMGGDSRPINFESPWLYKTGFTSTPKRKPKSNITTDTLRNFADNYDIVRDCIEHLKREARAVPIHIVARDAKDDSEATKKDIEAAGEFFKKSGGLGGYGRSRRHFEAEILEEAFVIGAYAVYLQPTRGGGVYSAVSLQSDTIVPIVDDRGWVDPEKAFFQVVNGVQRGGPYSLREIAYDGFHPVSDSPYFKSRVEYLVNVILAALKAHEWNLTWLTDGNVPDMLIACPENWTPDQLMQYTDYMDGLLSGDSRSRHKAKIVPGGMKGQTVQTRKDADFQEFERWLMERTCAIFGVAPSSIGFSSQVYKAAQEGGQAQTSQFGANDALELRKDLYDELLERNGYPHLEVKNVTEGEEDPMTKAQRLQVEVGKPWKSVNEARQETGLQPCSDPRADEIIAPEPEPTDGEDGKPGAQDSSKKKDLKRWERKVLSRIRDGRKAACEFQSSGISPDEFERVSLGLATAETEDDVRAVFAKLIEETQ